MSQENQPGAAPVAAATPGSPIHVNVQLPPSEQRSEEKPTKGKGEGKAAKKEARANEAAREKGARSTLKALGVPKEERDGLLKEIRETRSAKSLQEKLTKDEKARADKAEAELAALKPKVGIFETLAKQYADDQFAALHENAQKFIAKQAGDSLEKRLELIAALKESGMLSKQEAAAATAQAKTEAKPPKPATTSTAQNPKAPPATAALTPKQQWKQLQEQNPRLAAQYYAANAFAIDNDWSS